jgi:tetratricopeptide (TPR) repeat protein
VASFLFNSDRFAEAEARYMKFVEAFPQDPLCDEALLRAGMSAARQRQFVRANEIFGKLATDYPESGRLAESRFKQGEALLELGEFGAAILAFDEVINKFSDSELVAQAWGRKGDCQFMLGATEPARFEESLVSYRVVTQIPNVPLASVLEAEYKMGRCLQKQGQDEAALNQYYGRVMIPFLDTQASGKAMTESAKLWFVRAVQKATAYLEAQQQWRQMSRVLEHVAAAGVSISEEAGKRAQQIRQEHWWDFL